MNIYDLDIGKDVDDTCVAAMVVLNKDKYQPSLLISNDEASSYGRAAFLAKMVRYSNESIPVAAGLSTKNHRYKNTLVERENLVNPHKEDFIFNGIDLLLDELSATNEQVNYFSLGALTNLATVLKLRPNLANKINLIQMGPSLDSIYRKPGSPEYNVKIDIPSFMYVMNNVENKKFVMSHAASQKYQESNKQKLGIYPEGPVAKALKESNNQVLELFYKHLIAWKNDGKDCSVMYDPLTVLSYYHDDVVDFTKAQLVYNNGIFEITNESKKQLINLPKERLTRLGNYLQQQTTLTGQKTNVTFSLNTNFDKTQERIIQELFQDKKPNLAKEWKEYNMK